MIKLLHVVDLDALNNGKKTQALVMGENGKAQLLEIMRDSEGVIRRVINTSNKQPYTKVQLYNNSASALNLTEKETKELMTKLLIDVYRSSGATNSKGETLTREEQIAQGLARKITLSAVLVDKDNPQNTNSYRVDIIADTGASVKLEGEYTL